MTLPTNLIHVQDVFLLALAMWREARGTSDTEIQMVGCSVRNRVTASHGRTYASIVLQPMQYSSFNASDPQSHLIPNPMDLQWQKCLAYAEDIFNGVTVDGTNGSTHYYDKTMFDKPPYWQKAFDIEIQTTNFRFCKQKPPV